MVQSILKYPNTNDSEELLNDSYIKSEKFGEGQFVKDKSRPKLE